jgi:glycosyltransferase involved in cell wall biosynthesis
VSALGQEFNFKIITSDRDLGNSAPYPNVSRNRWVKIGNAEVMYLSPGWRGLLKLIGLLRSMDHTAALYLNSFFSRRFSMLAICLLRLALIHPGRLVLAPRGEFSSGALSIKRRRKSFYIAVSQWLKLYKKVIWHASSGLESYDIYRQFSRTAIVNIAAVLPKVNAPISNEKATTIITALDMPCQVNKSASATLNKKPGQLRVVFLSRISPMKNLLGALRVLKNVSGDVEFNIYGPAEDAVYWNECKKVIEMLPPNVRVRYVGGVEHDRVSDVFAEHDLFLFPTLGENYGHVIFEALAAGCPVLISDQTPWRQLADAGVGWDIPLADMEKFSAILQQCVDAGDEQYTAIRVCVEEYAKIHLADSGISDANRKLFNFACSAAE